jgi:hypothetical protein
MATIDGEHHEEEADCNGDGDDGRPPHDDGQAVEELSYAGGELSKDDPRRDAEDHPEGQVALEEAEPLHFLRDAGF